MHDIEKKGKIYYTPSMAETLPQSSPEETLNLPPEDLNLAARAAILWRTARTKDGARRYQRIATTLYLGAMDFLPVIGWVPPLLLIANHFGLKRIGNVDINLTPDLASTRGGGAARAARIVYDLVRTGGEIFTQGTFPSVAVDPGVWTQLLDHDIPALEKIFEKEKLDYFANKPELDRAASLFGVPLGDTGLLVKKPIV